MILAIETSCDEVSAALVDSDFAVHKNIIFSSSAKANITGGVVPEIAARQAALMMDEVLHAVTENIDWEKIDAIAVTNGPGLVGSLLTGIESAKTLAMIHRKPLIPVYHIFGHMCANFLHAPEEKVPKITFPALVLTVSGGHNDIYTWTSATEYEKIGTTVDDASGECFDKCARMLGLGYPGGPLLSKKAEQGNPKAFDFPRPLKHSGDYRFSFSGLKTALLYTIKELGGLENISDSTVADLAASVESAICETLLHKLFLAQKNTNIQTLMITGGVSANRLLRTDFISQAEKRNCTALIPSKIEYCTDNAAMIGAAAQVIWQNRGEKTFPFSAVTVR